MGEYFMKISASQYGKTLYEITRGKSSKEVDDILIDFIKLLSRNNQIRSAEEIMEKFREIYNVREGIVEAKVTSREKLEKDMIEKTERFIKDKYKAEKVEVNNVMDENMLGGIIIKVKDEVIDGSVRNTLAELKKNLIN